MIHGARQPELARPKDSQWTQMKPIRSVFTLVSLLILLAACKTTEYRYIPPATDAGTQCTSGCQNHRAECRSTAEERASIAYHNCMRESSRQYDQCLRSSDNEYRACRDSASDDYASCLHTTRDPAKCPKEECHKRSCSKDHCFDNNANFGPCERQFRGCYQQCGGQVEEVEVD